MFLLCKYESIKQTVKKLFTLVAFNCLFLGSLFAQKTEIFKGEVINFTDKNNLKQGLWVYFYDTLHTMVSCKGHFVDDKREGIWENIGRNGKLKSSYTYKHGQVLGQIKEYYDNGNIQEEGYWTGTFWVGEYRTYYENGKLFVNWFYDEKGNRTGTQEYYHDNGKLMARGSWDNGYQDGLVVQYYDSGKLRSESQWKGGNVHGVIKEYYESGSLKSESAYNNGKYDPAASRTYRDRVKVPVPQDTIKLIPPEVTDPVTVISQDITTTFAGTGYYKLNNSDGQVDREGDFVNGQLITGKRYYYNQAGKLIRVAVYERGRIVKTEDVE